MSLGSSTSRDEGYRDGFSGEAMPSTHVDGYKQDVADHIQAEELKKSIRDLLDGDSILQYETFEKFSEWLNVLLAYEETEEGDNSTLFLPRVFEELKREAKLEASGVGDKA